MNFYMHRYPDGTCPVLEFVKELSEIDQGKFANTIDYIDANKGFIKNEQKFKRLEQQKEGRDPFHEIKVHQIRVGCVFEGRTRLIMLHAFKKKSDAWPRNELEKLRNRYEAFDQQRRMK